MMNMYRSLGLIFVLAASSAWAQKMDVSSFTGDFQVNGSPYGGGGIEWQDTVRLRANESLSRATLTSGPQLSDFGSFRSMVKFEASQEVANYMLPSDRDGNMSSASEGDFRTFGTWNPNAVIGGPHTFNMELEEFDGFDAYIAVDVLEAPKPEIVGNSGTFTVGGLDGSAIDLDPRAGFVKIDKGATPSFAMSFSTETISFDRAAHTWTDGTTQNSLFYDTSWAGAWTVFDSTTGGNGAIFTADHASRYQWNPGDGPGVITDQYADVLNMNFSQLALGSYRVKHWSIGWWGIGNTEAAQWSNAFGGITEEITEMNVEIVPEPASAAVLALGASLLLRSRRAKARN